MFTLQLGKDKALEVTAVEERYAKMGEQAPATVLTLEAGPVTGELGEYVALFEAVGSPIAVLSDGEPLAEYTGYTELSDLALRLTSAGKMLSVTLKQPAALPA